MTDSGQLSGGLDSPSRRRRVSFPGSRKAKDAEHQKILSHIKVLHMRAKRLCSGKHETDQIPAVKLVTELLLKDVSRLDMDSAHEHADHLEELLPLVAERPYLRAVLTHELNGGDPDEGIKLSTVVSDAAFQKLRSIDEGTLQDQRGEVAESLSVLYRVRDNHMRHERLMAKLRSAYVPWLTGLIVALLCLLAMAILLGNPLDASLDAWAQVLAVAASGALGSVLAATFKLRDTVQLNPLRGLVAIIFIQPLIGASFGLISWLILTSGLVTIGGTDNKAWQTQVVVAFASGFSEPLSLNLVGRAISSQPSTGPQR